MRFLRTYGRVFGLLGRGLRVAALLCFCNVGIVALQFVDPILFGRVIGLLSNASSSEGPSLWQGIVPLLSVWAVTGVAAIVLNLVSSVRAERLAHRHRLAAMSRYYDHVLSLPMLFHDATHSGRIMKVMLAGTDSLLFIWLLFIRDQFATIASIVLLVPLTFVLNWRLALCLVVLLVLFIVLTTAVICKTEVGQRRVEDHNSRLAGTVQDVLSNVVVVQSFTRLAAERRIFGDIAREVIRNQYPVLSWWAVVNGLARSASTLTVLAIVILGTSLFMARQASLADIVSFMGLATLLIGRLESAVQFTASLFFRLPQLEEFFEILDTRSTVREVRHARPLVARGGEVAFEDVSFAYPGGRTVLEDISFTARPGTVTALVGQTGAGKSTTMALLLRFWDKTAGRILIDGQELQELTLESLRAQIGVVFQENMLFNRTIRDNLLVGLPDATDADLERACRMADAHDFIVQQPQGYDTLLGERGATLSGGQRQRLAIARAFLKDPPILVLDEATSALDAATEARIARALRTLMAGRTTFVIAHRLSTVRDADEILVFEGGRIVERGDFGGLLAHGGRFSELVRTQLSGVPDALAA